MYFIVFCLSEEQAYEEMKALRRRLGLSVPQALKIISYSKERLKVNLLAMYFFSSLFSFHNYSN